jgi:hypothetical protein
VPPCTRFCLWVGNPTTVNWQDVHSKGELLRDTVAISTTRPLFLLDGDVNGDGNTTVADLGQFRTNQGLDNQDVSDTDDEKEPTTVRADSLGTASRFLPASSLPPKRVIER